MYKLIGTTKTRAMRPLWLLEELELPYELISAGPRSPEAMAASPRGKVPVLETDEGHIFDSVAQMTYLADKHGGFTHRAGTFLRGKQDALTNTINETFDAVLWAYAKHSLILPEEHRVEAVKPSLMWQFTRYSEVMGEILGDRPFLMGDEPVVPDILLAHCCGWALGRKFEVDATVRKHMNTMRARPAFRRASAHG
ncbi:glutathione S-transferase family protein [Jannaschia faecimaris]|nr:glutathione S-transferase family protein [Jannaschia faecimaris]